MTLTLILEANADFVHFWRHDDAHICVCDETVGGRSEELRRRARKQERKKADMDRRERHNERHRQ